jgi:hypothetical protein
MKNNSGPENLKSLFNLPEWQANKKAAIKPPAHPWQDLALEVITQLAIPSFKRNSVFKICKEFPREYVMKCVNDTKELCKTGDQWKYFFKVVEGNKK